MSKQSDAKKAQGYVAKAVPKTCGNCEHFTYDRIQPYGPGSSYWENKNLRCEFGGFAVKKMATCNEFLAKENV